MSSADGARAQSGDRLPVGGAAGASGAAGIGLQAGTGAPPVPTFYVVDPSIPIPSNGSVLLQGTVSDPSVSVFSEGGQPIDGALRHVTSSYWAWKATAPLPVGSISVESPGSIGTTTARITVIEAMEIVPPPITSTLPQFSVVGSVSATQYCKRLANGVLFDDTAFAAKEVDELYLDTQLTTTASAALVHQFLFALHMSGADADGHYPFNSGGYQAGPYTEQADQYCFSFEAMDLTASARHPYSELMPRCAPHGELQPFGERDADVPDSVLDRLVCQTPPAHLSDRWCAINRSCADLAPAARTVGSGCLLYGYTCLGEALPDSEPSLTGGMTGGAEPPVIDPGASTGGDTGSGTGGSDGMLPEVGEDRPRLVRSGCGCFVGAQREGSAPKSPLLLVLGLLVVVQRVLRRQA